MTKKLNITVYKAVFGRYDKVLEMPTPGMRKILFSDAPLKVPGWENIVVQSINPIQMNREIKIRPWEFFDSDFSLYLDGRLEIKSSFVKAMAKMNLADKLFVPVHRQRGHVIDEVIRCIDNRKISAAQLKQALVISKLDAKAVECGLIIRDHSSKVLHQHADRWLKRFSAIGRDQLAFHDEKMLENLSVLDFDLSSDEFFILRNHRLARTKQIINRTKFAARIMLKGRAL